MAFVFTCDPDFPLDLVKLSGNGEHIVRTSIGYDDETDATFSIVVAMSPIPGHGGLHDFELVFSITETYIDDEAATHAYWDGNATKAFITEHAHRAMIRSIVLTLIAHLIDEVAPDVVSMVTHTPNLPNAALEKFHRIAVLFRENGYESGEADPWNGQRIWMMQRNVAV